MITTGMPEVDEHIRKSVAYDILRDELLEWTSEHNSDPGWGATADTTLRRVDEVLVFIDRADRRCRLGGTTPLNLRHGSAEPCNQVRRFCDSGDHSWCRGNYHQSGDYQESEVPS